MFPVLPLLLAFSAGIVAAANEPGAMFLAPQRYVATQHETIPVAVERTLLAPDDEAAEMLPADDIVTLTDDLLILRSEWPVDRTEWFFVRAAGTQINQDAVETDASGRLVTIPLEQPGATLVGFDARPVVETYEAAAFRAFLMERLSEREFEAIAQDLPAEGTVRVRRIESAKTIVRAGAELGGVSHSAVALSKSGQTSEFRPLIDPTTAAEGGDLLFRLYLDAPGVERIRVIATHRRSGRTREATTDSEGTVRFSLRRGGVWYLEAHAIRRLEQRDKGPADEGAAQWELRSATISFEIPGGEDEEEGGE